MEINSEDGEIMVGLMFELLDHYLGAPRRTDWPSKFIAFKHDRVAAGLKAFKTTAAKRRRKPDRRCLWSATSARTPIRGTATSTSSLVKGKLAIDFQIHAEHGRSARSLAVR